MRAFASRTGAVLLWALLQGSVTATAIAAQLSANPDSNPKIYSDASASEASSLVYNNHYQNRLWTEAGEVGEAAAAAAAADECSDIHIIVARASAEPQGYGVMKSLVNKLIKDFQSPANNLTASSEAIKYPATLINYGPSLAAGNKEMKHRIAVYVKRCPESKIVLLGFSQGAAVIGDTLCGGGGGPERWPRIAPLKMEPSTVTGSEGGGKNIVAVVQMGDSRFVPGLPFDAGTSKTKGKYARDSVQDCSKYASKMRSWCDEGDIRCASGNSWAVHMGYLGRYSNVAEKFVIKKMGLH